MPIVCRRCSNGIISCCLQNAAWRINDTRYFHLFAICQYCYHTKRTQAIWEISLLKSTYFIKNAPVIHMYGSVISIHYCKEFSSRPVKYLITLHTKSFIANHIMHSVREKVSSKFCCWSTNRPFLQLSLSHRIEV